MSEKYLAIKLVFAALIFVLGGLSALIPPKVKYFRNNPVWMSIANAFSGGIFLGIALLHMLPEASEMYNELTDSHHSEEVHEEEHVDDEEEEHSEEEHKHGFNLVFFLVFIGYALILLLEKVVLKFREHNHSHNPDEVEGEDELQRNYSTDHPAIVIDRSRENVSHEEENEGGSEEHNHEEDEERQNNGKADDKIENKSEVSEKSKYYMMLTPLALMIALIVHATFAGIAVGLEDSRSNLWAIIIAIALHKGGEGVSLGISLARFYKLSHQWIMYLIIMVFSISTPLGVIIGVLVPNDSQYTDITFTSLATGTFLYIGASHIITEEFEKTDWRWTKMFAFLAGAMIIMGVTYIE